MNNPSSPSWRINAFPLLALLFVSGVGVVMTLVRIKWTHDFHYGFLIWNLFLAWLPLVFALSVYQRHERGERGGWRIWAVGALWFLFFPNAPYIFTDLIHLTTRFSATFWVDLCLVLLVAFTGFIVGFVSLYLMQRVVRERLGRFAGWVFIVLVAAGSGFAVHLGRFVRLNSWDVVIHPWQVTHSIGHFAVHSFVNPAAIVFPTLFATFLFLGYLMLYALTHLQPPARGL